MASKEIVDPPRTPQCFLGYKGACANPDCPHTVNETTECERCGGVFTFSVSDEAKAQFQRNLERLAQAERWGVA